MKRIFFCCFTSGTKILFQLRETRKACSELVPPRFAEQTPRETQILGTTCFKGFFHLKKICQEDAGSWANSSHESKLSEGGWDCPHVPRALQGLRHHLSSTVPCLESPSPAAAPAGPLVTLVTLGPRAASAHFLGTRQHQHSKIFPLVKSESSENSPSNLLEEFNILSLPVFFSLHIKYSFLRYKNTLKPLYP